MKQVTIHHAVAKKAAKLGIELTVTEGGAVQAKDAQSGAVFTATSAGAALTLAVDARKGGTPVPAAKTKRPARQKAAKTKKADDEDEEEKESKSVIAPKYKKKYRPHKDTCGDEFVETLRAYLAPDGEEIVLGNFIKLARDNDVDPHRWDKHNIGMRRMNLGNVLRAKLRRGDDIRIGSKVIKGQKKEEAA